MIKFSKIIYKLSLKLINIIMKTFGNFVCTISSLWNGLSISVIMMALISFPIGFSHAKIDNYFFIVILGVITGFSILGGFFADSLSIFAKLIGRKINNYRLYNYLLAFGSFIVAFIGGILAVWYNMSLREVHGDIIIDIFTGVALGTLFGSVSPIFAYGHPEIQPDKTSEKDNLIERLERLKTEELIILSYDHFPSVYSRFDKSLKREGLIDLLWMHVKNNNEISKLERILPSKNDAS